MVLEVFLYQRCFATGAGKRACGWFHPADRLVFVQLRTLDVLCVAVVGAFDWVAWTHGVVGPSHDLVCVFVVAVLTADSTQHAVLRKMLLYVASHHRLPTLVDAEDGLVGTPLGSVEVGFHCAHLPRPLAALLVVRAVDFEHVDPLLKVLVLEVVEIGCVAVGACRVCRYPPLDAALTVVLAAAHDLDWLPEDFGA